MPDFEKQNFIVHHTAKFYIEFYIEQTKSLATRLLKNSMKKGSSEAEIDELVKKLLTREKYFSH